MRSKFDSQWIFVLAAVGSAAGLGNLWRFPYLAHEHGGGAFLVAYVVCLFLVGSTLLILETGLGQLTGKAAPGALASITSKGQFSYVGWLAIVVTFFITMYYVVITSWAVNYAIEAYHVPWRSNAERYFYHDFLEITPLGQTSHVVWSIVLGAIAVYALLFLCVRKGTRGVSQVARYITPIPFVLLILLAINSVQLPGASIGLAQYFHPDWSVLLNDDVWFSAASQVFFTLSIGFGVMYAYGALLKKEYSVRYTALAIVLGDTFVALVGGSIVYSVLGYLAQKHQVPIHEVIKGGIGLAFVLLPKALALLPTYSKLFSVLFYVALVGLAFTSIVSMNEAVVAPLQDANPKLKRSVAVFIIALLAFLGGLIYMRSNGMTALDIVDHYLAGYLLLVIGLLEVILIGWVYQADILRQQLNASTPAKISYWFVILVKYLIPLLLFFLIGKEIYDDIQVPYDGYSSQSLWLYGGLPIVFVLVFAFGLQCWARRIS